jgi:hypothetical protein
MRMGWLGETTDRDGMLHVPAYLGQNLTPTSAPCKSLGDQHGMHCLLWQSSSPICRSRLMQCTQHTRLGAVGSA